MKFVVNQPPGDKVDLSFVLLDWSCRESLHILDYLRDQNIEQARYEIIWIEYYNKPSPHLMELIEKAVAGRQPMPVDIYAVMEMDRGVCYHKHLMLNLGILLAHGQIVCFCDSDAMVKPSFAKTIIGEFEKDSNIVLHLDEARNNDPGFYPFRWPSFEEVSGFGCDNWLNRMPTGLLDKTDPLHSRNYGACMAALRNDLVEIGGSDMHMDYLGHIAGFNEMTWRLVNAGKKEVWNQNEFLYHTWHPGHAGDQNFAGPHDGMHISTRSLKCLHSNRTMPYVENDAIKMLRGCETPNNNSRLLEALVKPEWLEEWKYTSLSSTDVDFNVGGMGITMKEHGSQLEENEFRAELQPLFGRYFSRWGRIMLIPLAARLILHLMMNNETSSLPGQSHQNDTQDSHSWFGRKIKEINRTMAICRHWLRQSWLALAYAAQENKSELILYGQSDVIKVLISISDELPITIIAVCPLDSASGKSLGGVKIIDEHEISDISQTVVIAAYQHGFQYLDRVEKLGVDRKRIITLV